MKNILHITTHMGGGIGNTLSHMCIYNKDNKKFNHSILCLEASEKKQFLDLCVSNGVEVTISDAQTVIEEKIKKADIVQISWWHHPKMVKLLVEFPTFPTRLIIWSHVSGCNYPSVPFEFLKKANRVFFTSKYSYDNPYFSEKQRKFLERNSDVIYGTGNLSDTAIKCKKESKKNFNVGYVGTLEYSKLYPDFIRLCSKVKIPEVKFIMVGDVPHGKDILSDIKKYNMTDKIEFRGYTTDVLSELASFDVFGYPLNSYHFGTTENTILEAMISKVPVVAFNQCTEKYIIQNKKNGLLADNEDEYAAHITYLYHNIDEREQIGTCAKAHVLDEYSAVKKMKTLERAYELVLSDNPRMFEFKSVFGSRPYEWFLSCLGEDYALFKNAINAYEQSEFDKMQSYENDIGNCREILKGKSKSSIEHFYNYYKDDKVILYLRDVINKER